MPEINGVQAVTPTPETVQAEQPTFAIQETESGRRLVRVTPEVKIEPVEPAKAEPTPDPTPTPAPTEPTPTAESTEPTAKSDPYTAEELADAPDVTKIDQSRIPAELQPVYKSIIRGMNRKFQELAAEKKVLLEMADSLKKTEPAPPKANPKDFFMTQHNFIKAQVEEIFDGEEYNPIAYPEHQLAYNKIAARLESLEQQKQTVQQEEQSHKQKVAAVIEDLKAQPDWQEVLNFAHDNLPAKEWESGDSLLKSGDKEKVMAKYKEWRDKFYKVETPSAPKPVKAKPPVLETGGKGNEQTPPSTALDGAFLSKFRNANPQDKKQMIAQWRKSQGGK